jgi:hypothetical protein
MFHMWFHVLCFFNYVGHYDVQPALKSDGWNTDPFTLVEDDQGRLLGRGASDDKGISFHSFSPQCISTFSILKYNSFCVFL